MANIFKNYTSASVGTTPVTVYTVPAATTAVIIGCNIANRHTASVDADVQLSSVYVVKGSPVPEGSALSVLDGKMIAEAGDTIVVTSNTASGLDVILSVMEQN